MTHSTVPTNDSRDEPEAQYRELIRRLPLTMRPSLNGQLAAWKTLFPFEREQFRNFLNGVAAFPPDELTALVLPLRDLEGRMKLAESGFSEESDTMGNASLLARSQYYAEWRGQIQRIYSAVEERARSKAAAAHLSRLVLVVLPASLPFAPDTVWSRWGTAGTRVSISGDPRDISQLLLKNEKGLPTILQGTGTADRSDLWLIDAGSKLQSTGVENAGSLLSWTELKPLRDHVLERVNTVPRNIASTDRILSTVRSENYDAYWPPALVDNAPLRRFLIDLYLSGNGALIFPSAFVQWASSEALRRARPRVLIARLGLRTKPKPFTGIAIFENQQKISALPDVDDPAGSAVDASLLARYIYLNSERYPESHATTYVLVSESASSALLLPASTARQWRNGASATATQLAEWIGNCLASNGGAT